METQYTVPEKPALVNVIAWTTLASGVVNIGWGIAASAAALITIVGICCTPLTILPSILGIFEIIYAAKLLSSTPQPVKPATNIAVLEIVCVLAGNFFSMIVGVLSLVFYNDPAVKEYFARLNMSVPSEPVPATQPQIPQVVPVVTPPPSEEPIPSPITGESPVVAAAPTVETIREETTPSLEETAIGEPPVVSEIPLPPSPADETVVSSIPGEEPPSAPESPDEPDPSRKTPEE